jgi:uncharacterized membrane protein YraQ (UPF0718 family)
VTRAGEGTLDVRAPQPVVLAETGDRGIPLLVAAGTLAGALALAVAGRAAGAADVPEVETFVLIFASIVIEALPFILLGALVSAAIGVYVPDRVFDRIGRLPLALQVPGAALGGLAFPVCECGSVPVARRLIVRGVHPAAGIAFMLAAPVMNPIVLLSTWVAYSGRGNAVEMVAGRVVFGLGLAALAGVAIGRFGSTGLLRPRHSDGGHHHGHDHANGHGSSRREQYVEHLASDFLFMGKFIVLGAALAAAMQTLIPQSIVSGIAGSAVLAPLALMGLAFMLSLCSEADAFVAVSFTDFTLGSQLAFLVFGPMLDTKLALLYGATFRRAFALRLLLVAVPFLLLASLVFDRILA